MSGIKISQLQDLDLITGLENVVLQNNTANTKCTLNKIKEFTIKDVQLKEDGKGLSTNDFTNEDKIKLDSALTQIKTINGQSLIGEGNIEIQGSGSGISDAPNDNKKYVRQNSNWVEETKINTDTFALKSDISDVTSLLKTAGDAIQLGNPDKTLNINSKDGDVRINSYYYLPVMEAYPDDPTRRAIVLKNNDTLTGTSTTGDGATLIMLSKWDVVDIGSNKYRSNINAENYLVTINDDSRVLYSKEEAQRDKILIYSFDGSVISSNIDINSILLQNTANNLYQPKGNYLTESNLKTINGESLIGTGNITVNGTDNSYLIDLNKLITLSQNPDQNNENITEAIGSYDVLKKSLFVDNKIISLYYNVTDSGATSKALESSLFINGGDSTIEIKFLTMILTITGDDTSKEWKSVKITSNELADKRYVDTNLSYKSNKKVKTDLAGPYNNLTLTDSSCYNLVDINSFSDINIQLTPPDTINGNPAIGEYMLTFTTQDVIPTINLPENVKWIGDHTIEANKSYILAITDNFAVLGGV